jgi:chaperonin cofactor prefoldin
MLSASDTQRRQLSAAKGRCTESIKAAAAVMAEAEKVSDEIRKLRAEADHHAAAVDVDKLVTCETRITANEKILRALHRQKWFPASLNIAAMRAELRGLELEAATNVRDTCRAEVDQIELRISAARKQLDAAERDRGKIEREIEETPDEGVVRKITGSFSDIRKAAQDPACVVNRLQLADVLTRWENGKYIPERAVVFYYGDTGVLAGEPLIFETADHAGNPTGHNGATCEQATFREQDYVEALIAARR